jgi:hypothetical protein
MKVEPTDQILLALCLSEVADEYLDFSQPTNSRQSSIQRLSSQQLQTVVALCGVVGDIANVASVVLSMVTELERIKAEANLILNQTGSRLEITMAQIKALSTALDTMQRVILGMPNDYSDSDLMARKTEILSRMCDIALKIAALI